MYLNVNLIFYLRKQEAFSVTLNYSSCFSRGVQPYVTLASCLLHDVQPCDVALAGRYREISQPVCSRGYPYPRFSSCWRCMRIARMDMNVYRRSYSRDTEPRWTWVTRVSQWRLACETNQNAYLYGRALGHPRHPIRGIIIGLQSVPISLDRSILQTSYRYVE